MSSLVRVLTNTGKSVKFFNVDALTGKFFDRLIKLPAIKNLEVSDPDLETKLTPDELRRMREKFPYLAPKARKAEPLPLSDARYLHLETSNHKSLIELEAIEVDALGANEPTQFTSEVPPRPIAEETEPARSKRGRKPKQA